MNIDIYLGLALAFCGGFLVCGALLKRRFRQDAEQLAAMHYQLKYNEQMDELCDRYNMEREQLNAEYRKMKAREEAFMRGHHDVVARLEKELLAVHRTITSERNRRWDDTKVTA